MTVDAAGDVTTSIDALNRTTTFAYDSHYQLTATVDAAGRTTTLYDAAGEVTASVDRLNHTTTFVYDAAGTQTAVEDALGRFTTTSYDAAGQVTKVVDGLLRTTQYQYDLAGNETVVIDPTSARTTMAYDADNRVTLVTDANGHTTSTAYDYDGNVTLVTDALAHTTAYAYDADGRPTQVTDGDSRATSTAYDAAGEVTAVTNGLGTTSFLYDLAGRQTTVIDYNSGRTTIAYDADGETTMVTRPDSLSQSYRYDAGGQVTGQTDYFGNLTTTVYDADGEVSVTIDGLGQRTTMLYDGAGRVTTTIDALTHRTTSVYDADSRQTTLVDADGNSTIFIYDAVGNVTQQTEPNGHSATFAYDAANQLTATTDADGRLMTFSYDGDGRELGETWYTGSTALSTMINNIVTYTYDNVGNLSTAANYNGVYTMAYDNDNEMTLVHEPVGATLTMVYDGVGNRTEVDDSFGGTENSTYDALNRLINRSYTYGVTVQAHIEEAYDALNEVTQVKRDGAGSPGTPVSTTNYTYDDAGRITNIHDTIAGSGSNIANYTYTYDAAGNMQTEVLTRTTFTAVTTSYAYDADNQLTGDGTTTVTYDATGNRNNGSYATTTGNELTTDGVWTYTYDNAGNEIGKSNATDTWVYTYNNRNQLVEADRDATGTSTVDLAVAYKYDAFGNQIEEDVTQSGTTTTTKYVMDGWDPALAGSTGNSKWNVAADVTGGSLTTRYLRGDAVDQLFAELAYNGTSFTPDWTLTDIRGSVRTVIDNSGTVLDAINYGAFGNIITSGSQAETNSADRGRYAWTGQELDVQTGLQYNRARWYDSNTGRWLTQDPLGFDAGDSNLYRYANNQPDIATDPSGLQSGRAWIPGIVPVDATTKSESFEIGTPSKIPLGIWGQLEAHLKLEALAYYNTECAGLYYKFDLNVIFTAGPNPFNFVKKITSYVGLKGFLGAQVVIHASTDIGHIEGKRQANSKSVSFSIDQTELKAELAGKLGGEISINGTPPKRLLLPISKVPPLLSQQPNKTFNYRAGAGIYVMLNNKITLTAGSATLMFQPLGLTIDKLPGFKSTGFKGRFGIFWGTADPDPKKGLEHGDPSDGRHEVDLITF